MPSEDAHFGAALAAAFAGIRYPEPTGLNRDHVVAGTIDGVFNGERRLDAFAIASRRIGFNPWRKNNGRVLPKRFFDIQRAFVIDAPICALTDNA